MSLNCMGNSGGGSHRSSLGINSLLGLGFLFGILGMRTATVDGGNLAPP